MSIMLDNPPTAALPPLACPAWCQQPAGHPAELVVDHVEPYTLNEARVLLAGLAVGAVMIEGGR